MLTAEIIPERPDVDNATVGKLVSVEYAACFFAGSFFIVLN